MKHLLALAALLLPGLSPALAQEANTAQEAPPTERLEVPDLKDLLDGTVRWLRAQQDPASGGFGDVETTSWVLRALSSSPRAYRRSDGPLVARGLNWLASLQGENGAIRGDDLGATIQAAMAFSAFPDSQSQAAAERASKFVKDKLGSDLSMAPQALESDEKALLTRVHELVNARADNGSWQNGDVRATARAAYELGRASGVLKTPAQPVRTARALPNFSEANRADALSAMRRGALFLTAASLEGGGWGAPGRADAGLTAMALGALQTLPVPRPSEVQVQIDSGLTWLASLQKSDGSIHQGMLPNYVTSASLLALQRAGRPEFAEVIRNAQAFLIALQSDEGEGYSEDDLYYGGIGYGGDERPDLSNLQMALDALASSGLDSEHEAFRRALKYLERTQNRSESNDTRIVEGDEIIVAGDDGGGVYYPGNSKAGSIELPDGSKVARSYGSMTYALLKGFIFAGLPKDDPRMQAAWKWLSQNYTLDVNPGFEASSDPLAGYQGLFYYLHTMARALDLYGAEQIVDAEGKAHDWRRELTGRIVSMQNRETGFWINENAPRWWEGNPLLGTSYALLALDAALPKE